MVQGAGVMSGTSCRRRTQAHDGFSLLELLIATALIATLSAMVVPTLMDARERGKAAEAATMISALSLDLQRYRDLNGRYPATLAEAGLSGQLDPWGNEYRYLRIEGKKGLRGVRKDRFLVPINSDYDLYSVGPDGRTRAPLSVRVSLDDMIRANNGAFVGPASEF
jgi:general secretion pathway protein G